MKKIVVKGKYLAYSDGTPFFMLGDTAWSMPKQLNKQEIDYYFEKRKSQGFNTVLISALCEGDGITGANRYNDKPFLQQDEIYNPLLPDMENISGNYWTHLDYIVDTAKSFEIYIGLLPTWGDKYYKRDDCPDPEIFTVDNAKEYAKWLAKRYCNCENIFWVLGGDRPLVTENHKKIIDQFGNGLREGDGGSHLITFHPCGAATSADFVKNKSYIDFHMAQSGHGLECYKSHEYCYEMSSTEDKPYIDAEPRYEDFPACFNTDYHYNWDSDDIRQNAYWNILEGTCGHIYGHRDVWCFGNFKEYNVSSDWVSALDKNGANQMRYLKSLRLKNDFFSLVPAPELLSNNYCGMAHCSAAKGNNYCLFYSPLGLPLNVTLSEDFGKAFRCSWFYPKTGEIKTFAFVGPGENVFVPEASGKGNDIVLMIDVFD